MAGIDSRKPTQPYREAGVQDWANNLLLASHEEALYAFGEYVLFTMLWRAQDYQDGLVDLCTECAVSRQALAFNQPERKKCDICYGTTFANPGEGGFRAQIIRPVLWGDSKQELGEEKQGQVYTDTINIETTSDFILRKGDFAFRGDGLRYQVEEKDHAVLRTGFDLAPDKDSFQGSATVHLEEQTAVCYIVPPTDAADLVTLLDVASGKPVWDLPAADTISTNGYLL